MLTAAARWRVQAECVYPGRGGSSVHEEREMPLDHPGSGCRWVGFTARMRVTQSGFDHICSGGRCSNCPTDRKIISFTSIRDIHIGSNSSPAQ